MGIECERNPPTLDHFDAWGNRIDQINTCQAWKRLHDISAQEGLIAIAYQRNYQQWRYMYVYMDLFVVSQNVSWFKAHASEVRVQNRSIKIDANSQAKKKIFFLFLIRYSSNIFLNTQSILNIFIPDLACMCRMMKHSGKLRKGPLRVLLCVCGHGPT